LAANHVEPDLALHQSLPDLLRNLLRNPQLHVGAPSVSSRVRVAVTLPGLVPLLGYSQLHVGASSVSQNKFILRFAAAKNKKRVVSRNGCEIDSSRVRVAVTLSGLVPLRRYAQIHVVASSHPPSLSKPNAKTQNNRVSEFYQHMVLRKQA